jgi:hypothetical protein
MVVLRYRCQWQNYNGGGYKSLSHFISGFSFL